MESGFLKPSRLYYQHLSSIKGMFNTSPCVKRGDHITSSLGLNMCLELRSKAGGGGKTGEWRSRHHKSLGAVLG